MRSLSNNAPLLLLLAATVVCPAQTTPPAEEKPASLEGEVRNILTGLPVERVHVSLRRFFNGGFDRYGAQTTADGKFSIVGIAPGNYNVNLDRVGYVVGADVTRTQLKLGAAEKKENFKLKVIPVGSISGRVMDADGAPMEGISVSAELAGRSERAGVTDDRGQYRIGGLRPGKYRVRAVIQAIPLPPEIRTDGTTEVNYGSTYHPAALDLKSATALTVGPATDVTGIDIRMVRTPILRIAGRVSGVPEGVRATLQLQAAGGQPATGTQVKPDGSFELWRVNPGKYTAVATFSNSGEYTRSVPVEFEVGESEIDNLELRVQAPEDIKGQLDFDDEGAKPRPPQQRAGQQPNRQTAQPGGGQPGGGQPPQSMPMRRIMLRDPNNMSPTKVANIGEDGSFTLEKVAAGRYIVAMNGYPGYVKSVQLGQKIEEGPALDLRYGAAGAALKVTLSSAYASITGVVSDDKGPAAGARVVLRDTDHSNITNGAMSGAEGTYTIRNLPPGKYKLMALDEAEANLMSTEANLDDFDDRAETVEVHAKDTLSRDLKLRVVAGK